MYRQHTAVKKDCDMEYTIKDYEHFGKCIYITNGIIEMVIPLEFGPRIVRFCLNGHPNILYEQPDDARYLCTEDGWRVHGGQRLALAPESAKTYWPDNQAISYSVNNDGILLTQPEDEFLHVQKTIELRLSDDPNRVEIKYGIKNLGDHPITGAPWAITAMRAGGVLTVPFRSRTGGTAPNRFLSLWGATSLSDKRISFDVSQVQVRHLDMDDYFKLGLLCRKGTVRYDVCGQTFTKQFAGESKSLFPDNNVNFEVFCCRQMMEIESLASLGTINPGETAVHTEVWNLSETTNHEFD